LIIVVAIIAVIAAIAIPTILSARKTAKCVALFAELKTLIADSSSIATDTGKTVQEFVDSTKKVIEKLKQIVDEGCVDKTFVATHKPEFDAVINKLNTLAEGETDADKKDKLEKAKQALEKFVQDQTAK
jgi:Tfp pilus assembly protein FimT